MAKDIQIMWHVMTSLARYGPRGRGRMCESIRQTRTGRVVLWTAWLLIATVSAYTMFTIMAVRQDLISPAIEI